MVDKCVQNSPFDIKYAQTGRSAMDKSTHLSVRGSKSFVKLLLCKFISTAEDGTQRFGVIFQISISMCGFDGILSADP